jgi:hypothetical protein
MISSHHIMENWEFEFEWLRLRSAVKKVFDRDALPDLNGILFIIGMQELGRWKKGFTKEEKQDLMHVAVCRLLSYDGHYEFIGRDADGWPHWKMLKPLPARPLEAQEQFLKEKVIQYFRDWEAENGTMETEN